jgi:putative ABC transport system ATP-binding protein
MTNLAIRDLTIEYTQGSQRVRPVEGLDVDASDGELVVLLGPSGSGKTTLLACLAGILTPAAGRIRVGDTEVTKLKGRAMARYRRHTVGVIFQAFNLIPSLTARENVMAPLRLARVRARKARQRATALLDMVGLENRMDHRPRALSGGQQQRVAIARALVHEPPVVLADEPTAYLDHAQVDETLRMVRKVATAGRLVVVATHDERVLPLADRIIELTPATPEGNAPPRRVELKPGQVLFERGMTSDFVYVVDEGRIDLVRGRPDHSEEILRSAGPGEYFGELGPLLRRPRSATARAVSHAVVTRHGARNFKHLVNQR